MQMISLAFDQFKPNRPLRPPHSDKTISSFRFDECYFARAFSFTSDKNKL